MIERENNGIRTVQFASLSGNDRIRHAVFTRHGGVSPPPFDALNMSVSVADAEANVMVNRARAYGLFGRTQQTVVHAHLVHGRSVARVTQRDNGVYIPLVDGLITNEPGCALTMNFADCAPIFLYDPRRHAIGLGHAGWKGAVKDLPGAMVQAMQQEFGSDPALLLAGVGPCIGAAWYEVGEPVITGVRRAFADADSLLLYINGSSARAHFDLAEANRRNLLRAGVRQIEMSGLCTAERTDFFFSHRAENGRTGRFGAIYFLEQ